MPFDPGGGKGQPVRQYIPPSVSRPGAARPPKQMPPPQPAISQEMIDGIKQLAAERAALLERRMKEIRRRAQEIKEAQLQRQALEERGKEERAALEEARRGVAAQVSDVARYQKPRQLTDLGKQGLAQAQELAKKYETMGKIMPAGEKAAKAFKKLYPTFEIDEYGVVTPEQLETLKAWADLGYDELGVLNYRGKLEKLMPENLLAEAEKVAAEWSSLSEKPATISALDKMEAMPPEATVDDFSNLFNGFNDVQKKSVSKMFELYEKLEKLKKRIDGWIGQFGTTKVSWKADGLDDPGLSRFISQLSGVDPFSVVDAFNKGDARKREDILEGLGVKNKNYGEIYGARFMASGYNMKNDDAVAAIDPDYQAFREMMDARYPETATPLPDELTMAWREYRQGKVAGGNVPVVGSVVRGIASAFNTLADPLGKGVSALLGFFAILDELPSDIVGLIAAAARYWAPGTSPRDAPTVTARFEQLGRDIAAPFQGKIPQGRWGLPPELQEYGFSWFGTNPWVHFAATEILSLQWLIPGLTQAGKLTSTGSFISKITNLSPDLGDALRLFAKAPSAETWSDLMKAWKTSGIEGKIVRDAFEASAKKQISDWVKPTANVLSNAKTERQFAKLIAASMPTAQDPKLFQGLLAEFRKMDKLPQAQRAEKWGHILTSKIAHGRGIPVKPGVITRLPTKFPRVYESMLGFMETPAGYPLRRIYAGLHPASLRLFNVASPEAAEKLYADALQIGMLPSAANKWVERLLETDPLTRGVVVRDYDKFLRGDGLLGINPNATFAEMQENLMLNIPIIDPVDVRRLMPELEGFVKMEDDIQQELVGYLKKLKDKGVDIKNIPKVGIATMESADEYSFDLIVRLVKSGTISVEQGEELLKKIGSLIQEKKQFVRRVEGLKGELGPVVGARKGLSEDYIRKIEEYGSIELPNGKKIFIQDPMTTHQLSQVYSFKHDSLYEIYRFKHKEMTAFLKLKGYERGFMRSVEALLNRASMGWKRWFIYPRGEYVIKTYLTDQVKGMIMHSTSPTSVRQYNTLIKNEGIGIIDGKPVLLDDASLKHIQNEFDRAMTEPYRYYRGYTGSWTVADSKEDIVQALRNLKNQFLTDPGVTKLLKEGDEAFLEWARNTYEGRSMLKRWKPLSEMGDEDDIAVNYMNSLKEYLKQAENSAPETFKALLYHVGIKGDYDDLDNYFKAYLDEMDEKLNKDILDPAKRKKPPLPIKNIEKYLAKNSGKENFVVPMVKHPYWAAKKTEGKIASWIRKDGDTLYRKLFFSGNNIPKSMIFKTQTMKIAKQLLAQGIPEDKAFRLASSFAAKVTNDILLDFSHKLAFERKYDFLFPFMTALRLDIKSWVNIFLAKPGAIGLWTSYYTKTQERNRGLPGYLRDTIPIDLGDRKIFVNVPLLLMTPWAYSTPTGNDPTWYEIAQGVLGPLPRGIVKSVFAGRVEARRQELLDEWYDAQERGDAKEMSRISGELDDLSWQSGGFMGEMGSATIGYGTWAQEGYYKGTIRRLIDSIPPERRKEGWTRSVFESDQLPAFVRDKMAYNMGIYLKAHPGSNLDEAFLWAYDQLHGAPFGGEGTSQWTGALTALGQRFIKPPGTTKTEEWLKVREEQQKAIEEGRPYYTTTPFTHEVPGERMSPYEWQEQKEERAKTGMLRAAEASQKEWSEIGLTAEPEKYPALAEERRELPEWGGWTEADTLGRERALDALAEMSPVLDLPVFRGTVNPAGALTALLRQMGYTKEGLPSEQLNLWREYEKGGQKTGQSWQEFLERKAKELYPFDPAAQERVLSYSEFYPYSYASNPAAAYWYGEYEKNVTKPYWELIEKLRRLRKLLKGYGETDMTAEQIQAEIEKTEKELDDLIEKSAAVPNLEMEIDLNRLYAPLRAGAIALGKEPPEFGEIKMTTEKLREMAGLPPLGEAKMPSPPEVRMARYFKTPEDRKGFLDALVAITSHPSTWGVAEIPVDMKTALYLNPSWTVEDVKNNYGEKGLGNPFYDEETGKVYVSSFPIDWLDKPTQEFIKANVDAATWAKILANASKKGGKGGRGGGWRGAKPSRGFAVGGGEGPLTPEGLSKAEVFFTLPSSEKNKYLDENPDLKAYFRRQKENETDEEYAERIKLMDLAERYFRLPSAAARRGFLRDHPELVAYFEALRRRKDLYFMRAMANAFVDNPELWELYLENQNRLTETLIKHIGKQGFGGVRREKEPAVSRRGTRRGT